MLRAVFAGALAASILLAAANIPVIPDEAYYWTWSRDLSWSYYDHPPGIAVVLAASTAIFGDGWAGLRLPSLLAMAAVLGLSAASARRLAPGARDAGWLAVLLLVGAPMFSVGYLPGTHDPLQGAAMALAAWLLIAALDPEERRFAPYAALAAFVLAAAVLIKHSSAIVALGALAGLAATRVGRLRLGHPAPWIGLAAGLALAAPWLLHELGARGGSIAFQAAHVFDFRPARGPVALPLTLGSIALTFGPLTALALLVVCFRRPSGAAALALAAGAVALLAACTVAVWTGSGEANWPMPALVFAAPLVAAEVSARPRVRRWVAGGCYTTAVVLSVYLIHVVWPFLPIPERRDPAMRAAGFERLARAAEARAEAAGAVALAARRYQAASLLRYHLRDRLPVLELSSISRETSPRSRKSQYDRWPPPEVRQGDVVVVVSGERGAPAELPGTVIGEVQAAPRGRDPARPVDTWWIRAVRTASAVSIAGPLEAR